MGMSTDSHRRTAALMFEKAEEEVTPAERRLGKSLNLVMAVGIGNVDMGERLGMTPLQAHQVRSRFCATVLKMNAPDGIISVGQLRQIAGLT
jgi:DNA polymerase I-like protein with 3'-5' exonuclease and polymerase domains